MFCQEQQNSAEELTSTKLHKIPFKNKHKRIKREGGKISKLQANLCPVFSLR